MRFLDVALSSLRYEMNLSSLYVGTDGEKILFNPRYLIQRYLSDRVLVNRAYLHMLLHCLFRHPFHQGDRDEEYWNLACDIAVESMVDALPFKSVRLVVSDRRNEWYDKLRRELKVLSAEGIYEVLQKEKPVSYTHLDVYKRQGMAVSGAGTKYPRSAEPAQRHEKRSCQPLFEKPFGKKLHPQGKTAS